MVYLLCSLDVIVGFGVDELLLGAWLFCGWTTWDLLGLTTGLWFCGGFAGGLI